MVIRPVKNTDLNAILRIQNHVIKNTNAIYVDDPISLPDIEAWAASRTAQNYPILIATDQNDHCIGYASYGDFRPRHGYRFSVEHSVHIDSDHRGQGIGHTLMQALIPLARAQGKHIMIGAVDGSNPASIRFHKKLGFEQVARLPEIGRKGDHWLDLVFMQLNLEY